MKFNSDYDYLKVRYIGDYYNIRLDKNKTYFAIREPDFGMLRLTDDLGEENSFLPDEFEIVKVLKNGGLPLEDDYS